MTWRDQIYDVATRAFPASWVDRDTFVAYVEARVKQPEGLTPEVIGSLYLACACVRAVALAVQRFETEYLPNVRRAAARTGLNPDQLGELLQDLREALLVGRAGGKPTLSEYLGKGDLRGWLRVIVTREALRRRKKYRASDAREVESFEERASDDDPELAYMKAVYRESFRAALHAAAAALDPKERLILQQSAVQDWSIDKIGEHYGVHRATAARWIQAARAKLFAGVRSELAVRAKVNPRELNSILRLVQSRFEVTMRRILA